MTDPFSVQGNFTFHRQQPREWRDQPFAGERRLWPGWRKAIGWTVFYCALFGVSLWSINQNATTYETRSAK